MCNSITRGSDNLRTGKGKIMAVIYVACTDVFVFCAQQAEQLGREDQKRLHRNRKLVLMVDLDQTLIHTTEQHCQHMSTKVSLGTKTHTFITIKLFFVFNCHRVLTIIITITRLIFTFTDLL